MKHHRTITTLLVFILNILCFSQFAGGSGTYEDPYLIETAEQLNQVRNYMTSSFKQIADIDLGVPPWNEGTGWDPIGDYDPWDDTKSFRGNYNGDGLNLFNLYINRPDESQLGLFGSTLGCVLTNIHLGNINIFGQGTIGGIVAISYNDVVSNCYVEGKIEGNSLLGLLMYFFEGYTIENCHVKGEITGTDRGWIGGFGGIYNAKYIKNCSAEVLIIGNGIVIGGLLGQTTDVELIENCYVTCNISTNEDFVGGLFAVNVQSNKNTIIKNCYTTGTIISIGNNVGGFIGQIGLPETSPEYIGISNCFSTVDVTGNDYVAGFVAECAGAITDSTLIQNCYSTGKVTGNLKVGGFIGSVDSLNTTFVYNSYWDTETSGQLTSIAGEGRTTAEMTLPYSGNTYTGWDFDSVWADDIYNLNSGYPRLEWACGIEDNDDDFVAGDKGFELYKNSPNPFNPVTQIKFDLAKSSEVKLSVYNISGQLVSELTKGIMKAGKYSVEFDGKNLNSGVYYYVLSADKKMQSRQMLLLK